MSLNNCKQNGPTKMPLDNPMFTLFNRLPTELRLKIWEAARPGPRVVNIKERLVERNGQPTWALWSPSKAPSPLFACRESHHVALKFFVPCFAFASSIPETYFDFRTDTCYLRFDAFADDCADVFEFFIQRLERIYDTDHVRQVQNLAVLLNPEDVSARVYQLAQILSFFGSIQKLTVVVGHFDREEDDQGDILFIEAIDVTKTIQNYEALSQEPPQFHETMETPLAMDLISPAELESSLENRRHFNRILTQERIEEGREVEDLGDIPMPHIEYKSVITGSLKSRLDSLREEYRQKIKEHDDQSGE
ncbi:uncharacterized protein LY89DRAFT_760559 [Mollisia scopiformis]|uniref:2EXR domain-containing protein n=1 Tax=Mollisia scopiformis TaxID=149040 RepID=A0A132BFT3_MOLSC|nr:uncharacterized protein LY89DRAFT_760559 [Mollisia scopiformis]KUJ10577.1 hypothetical protein LY89DRAFT_760559 [Mollisia scopiformis]